MNIAVYARVSTDKQETENQLLQLREFASKQDWRIVHEYVDDGVSGTKSERAALQRMFADAARRKFDCLLFWALDRLSREGTLPTLQYLNRLESYGVGFRSFTEPYFDSCGIFKDVVLAVTATLAKQESVRRSERAKAAIALKRARGQRIGRKPVTLDLERVSRMRLEGYSVRQIAKRLGCSVGRVHKSIRQFAA